MFLAQDEEETAELPLPADEKWEVGEEESYAEGAAKDDEEEEADRNDDDDWEPDDERESDEKKWYAHAAAKEDEEEEEDPNAKDDEVDDDKDGTADVDQLKVCRPPPSPTRRGPTQGHPPRSRPSQAVELFQRKL